jgi:hypothetical protein
MLAFEVDIGMIISVQAYIHVRTSQSLLLSVLSLTLLVSYLSFINICCA